MSSVRWSIVVTNETDRATRSYLAGTGAKNDDLSQFVEEAVQIRRFDLTVQEVEERNQASPPAEILEAIEAALGR